MLKKIRLELARTAGGAAGDAAVAYQITAPLDRAGRLDAEGWRANRDKCVVIHSAPGAAADRGVLIRTADNQWALSYGPDVDRDEPTCLLRSHVFKVEEYVSISGHGGKLLPFKVVSIDDV